MVKKMLSEIWPAVCQLLLLTCLLQVHSAATANGVYNGRAMLVKRDQLLSLNCIKWIFTRVGSGIVWYSFKAKEKNILATHKFFSSLEWQPT